MSDFTFNDVVSHVGESFAIGVDESSSTISLLLIEAKHKGADETQEQFCLYFKGDAACFLPQGIYSVKHESIGSQVWMLVPIGEDEQGYLYEAVFHRWIKK